MSFDSTKNSISTLSSANAIAIDEMLEMFESVMDDVSEFNGTQNISSFGVSDRKNLLKRFRSIMTPLVMAYKENKSGITEFSSTLQTKFEELETAYAQIEPELKKLVDQIKISEDKENEIKAAHDECMEKNRELVRIEENCKRMQAEIDSISDLDLEALKKDEQALTEDLEKRRSQKEALDEKIKAKEQNISEIETKINELTRTDADLAEKFEEQESEKESLEKNIALLKDQIAQIQEWIDNFQTHRDQVTGAYNEQNAKAKAIINAWNAVATDPFLVKALAENPDGQFFGKSDNIQSLSDINAWFENLSKCIKASSETANQKMKHLTTAISKITEPIQSSGK